MTQNHTVENNLEGFNALMSIDTQFDDILPEPIHVSIIDFVEEKIGELHDGKAIIRRKPTKRTAIINTYVPMKILHGMMRSQERMRHMQVLQQEAQKGQLSQGSQQMMLEWMTEQVLAVWQLTEPEMTADKLAEGLSFQKLFGLFRVFFGDLLSSMNQQKLP